MPDIIRDIGIFIVSVLVHWQGYATGGLVTALLQAWEKLTGKPISRRVYINLVLIGFLLVSFFMAWRDERLARPHLIGRIDTGSMRPPLVGMNPGTVLSVIASIRNAGVPSIAERYQLTVSLGSDKQRRPTLPLVVPDLNFQYPNGVVEHVYAKDSLPDKTSKAIASGDMVRGRLFFFLPDVDFKAIKDVSFFLDFSDVLGVHYNCSTTSDNSGPNTNLEFPGIERRFERSRTDGK